MTEEKNGLNLVQKVAKIQSGIGKIKKEGHNTVQNYDFVTEAQVKEIIRQPLAELGVIMNPKFETIKEWSEPTKKGGTMHYASVLGKFELSDGFTTITGSMPGTGMDTGDKAVYKAETGAQKNYLMQLFMISTGDDPEQDMPAFQGNSRQINSNRPRNNNYRGSNNNNYNNSNNYRQSNNNQQRNRNNGPANNVGHGKITNGMFDTIKSKMDDADYAWQSNKGDTYIVLKKKYGFNSLNDIDNQMAQNVLLYLNDYIKSAKAMKNSRGNS